MQRSASLGVIALLMSGAGLGVPVLADAARAATDSRLAVARPSASAPSSDPAPEADAPQEQAIREQQDSAPEARPAPAAPQPIAPAPAPAPVRSAYAGTGEASWYGPGFFGNRTANGEVFRPGTLTAAHRTLPFGTMVRVTNLWNGRTAVVRINDRGPFHGRRIIDLGHGAAQKLGLISSGIAQVRLEVIQ